VAKWVIAVALLAVLTVAVTLAINFFGNDTRSVQVPDVSGQLSADATAALQNRGFKTRVEPKTDSVVAPDHVISTDPAANSSVDAGAEITLNVSFGPEQRQVPDCATMTYAQCVQKLKDAGFTRFMQSDSPSAPDQLGKVLGTSPPANSTSAITNVITIAVGSGPGTKVVPPGCIGQTVDVCRQIIGAAGFLAPPIEVPTDSTEPAGQVVGTDPAAGQTVAAETVIQIQVSRGNQFIMPPLVGQFWTDAEQNLRALGWTGILIKGADVQNSGLRSNAIVTQSPQPGAAVTFGSPITLSFAS
jgi:serine/threonine-protein kinase